MPETTPREFVSLEGEDVTLSGRKLLAFHIAAIVSKLAYADNPQITLYSQHREAVRSGLLSTVIYVDPKIHGSSHRLVFAWSPYLEAVVIGFRGTDFGGKNFADDVRTDLHCLPVWDSDHVDVKLHTGFFKRTERLPYGIMRRMMDKYSIILTGHSLG